MGCLLSKCLKTSPLNSAPREHENQMFYSVKLSQENDVEQVLQIGGRLENLQKSKQISKGQEMKREGGESVDVLKVDSGLKISQPEEVKKNMEQYQIEQKFFTKMPQGKLLEQEQIENIGISTQKQNNCQQPQQQLNQTTIIKRRVFKPSNTISPNSNPINNQLLVKYSTENLLDPDQNSDKGTVNIQHDALKVSMKKNSQVPWYKIRDLPHLQSFSEQSKEKKSKRDQRNVDKEPNNPSVQAQQKTEIENLKTQPDQIGLYKIDGPMLISKKINSKINISEAKQPQFLDQSIIKISISGYQKGKIQLNSSNIKKNQSKVEVQLEQEKQEAKSSMKFQDQDRSNLEGHSE